MVTMVDVELEEEVILTMEKGEKVKGEKERKNCSEGGKVIEDVKIIGILPLIEVKAGERGTSQLMENQFI